MKLERIQAELKQAEDLHTNLKSASAQAKEELQRLQKEAYQEAIREIFRIPRIDCTLFYRKTVPPNVVYNTPHFMLEVSCYYSSIELLKKLFAGPLKDSRHAHGGLTVYPTGQAVQFAGRVTVVDVANDGSLLPLVNKIGPDKYNTVKISSEVVAYLEKLHAQTEEQVELCNGISRYVRKLQRTPNYEKAKLPTREWFAQQI